MSSISMSKMTTIKKMLPYSLAITGEISEFRSNEQKDTAWEC